MHREQFVYIVRPPLYYDIVTLISPWSLSLTHSHSMVTLINPCTKSSMLMMFFSCVVQFMPGRGTISGR